MEAFSLVAKLTLDTKEYEEALNDAVSSSSEFPDVDLEASVDLNTSEFDKAIDEVENTDIANPESPELGLEKEPFDNVVEAAEGEDISDPEKPELDLDPEPFDREVEEAEGVDIADPEKPELGLNAEEFNEALEQSKADAEVWSGEIGDIFNNLRGILVTAGIATAVTGIVSSLSDAVDLARKTGDNIDKSSRAMSISTDAYQEWSHVMDINGASITDLNRGLMNMRKLMGGGDAPKEFADAMVQLGLATSDAEGNISSQFSSTEDMLKAAMKALADFDTSTSEKLAQRDYLAQAIFGRGGTKLNAMFDGTSKDIDDLIEQAHELGLVMDEESVKAAATYNDAVTNMNASIEAFKRGIGEELLPKLTDVVNTITTIVTWLNPKTRGKDNLSNQLADINDEASKTAAKAEASADEAKSLIDRLAELGERTGLSAKDQAEWNRCAERAIELFPQLSGAIDPVTGSIKGNTEEIKKNIDQWKDAIKQEAIYKALKDKQAAITEKQAEAWEKEFQAKDKIREADSKRKDIIDKLNQYSFTGFDKLGDDATFEQIKDAADTIAMSGGAGDIEWIDEIDSWLEAMNKPLEEAERLQAEADKINEEVKKATEELARETAYLEESFDKTAESANGAKKDVDKVGEAVKKLPDDKFINIHVNTDSDIPHYLYQAKGNWDVPYDGYLSELHRGEIVLSASQARSYREGNTGNSAEIVSAIQSLRNDMTNLQIVVGRKTFGRTVVNYGGERMNDFIGESDSRYAAGYGT